MWHQCGFRGTMFIECIAMAIFLDVTKYSFKDIPPKNVIATSFAWEIVLGLRNVCCIYLWIAKWQREGWVEVQGLSSMHTGKLQDFLSFLAFRRNRHPLLLLQQIQDTQYINTTFFFLPPYTLNLNRRVTWPCWELRAKECLIMQVG